LALVAEITILAAYIDPVGFRCLGIPRGSKIQTHNPPSMTAGMNWSFRLVLRNPEAPGHGDVVFLVFIPPEP
jgi:hypothetical protein